MSVINTRVQNIRAKGNLDKNEIRPSIYGGLDLFMKQSEDGEGILTPEMKQKAMESIGSTFQVPVIDYDGGITITNTRSVTIADSENTSQMVTVTFATYAGGFTQVPTLFHNNEIGAQLDFEAKLKGFEYKLADTLDTACIAALSAAKTQVFKDSLDYTLTGNVVKSTWAKRENLIGDVNSMMTANDYFNGMIHLLGNTGIDSVIRKMAEKGLYNEVNKQLEYNDKILHYSNRLTNGSGVYGTGYAVAGGMLGLLTRYEREALYNIKSATGHEWSIEVLPHINFPVGSYYYQSVGDFNAIAGAASADMTRAWKEHFGFAVDVAIVTPYNSSASTIASPIMKVEILSESGS